jgi:hypothetical protein
MIDASTDSATIAGAIEPAEKPQRVSKGFSTKVLLQTIVVLAVLAVVPIFSTRYLPLHDYPFHLARMVILTHLDNPIFARFYAPSSFLLPNVAMDAFVLPLSRLLGAELAARAFVGLSLVTMLLGTIFLHWAAHRRVSIWPFLAIVILHGGIFRFGFFNYVFGLGLALAAAGLWMFLKPGIVRLGAATLSSIFLIFCHLEAFGVFAIIVGSIEIDGALERCRQEGVWRTVCGLVYSASPFLACAALFVLFSPTAGEAGKEVVYATSRYKMVSGLFSLSSGIVWLDVFTVACVVATCAWLAVNRYLLISRPLLFASIAMTLCLFLVPTTVMGAWFADIRLGPAIAALLIASVDLAYDVSKIARLMVLALIMTLAILRSVVLTETWKDYGDKIGLVVGAIDKLEPGATLFAATTQQPPDLLLFRAEKRAAWQPPLKHVASFAVLGTPVFVPMTFANPTQQPLAIQPAFRPLAVFQDTNPILIHDSATLMNMIAGIQSNLDNGNWPNLGNVYILLVDPKPLEPLLLPDSVFQADAGDRFVLLRFKRTACEGRCPGSPSAKEN